MTRNTRWRTMTDEELSELQLAARERRRLRSPEDKAYYSAPQAAEETYSGAIYWALAVLAQDNPLFLCVSIILICWVLLRTALGAIGIIIL